MPARAYGDPVRRAGPLLVLAAALLWGTIGTAHSLLPPAADPQSVAATRVTIGGLAFLAITRPADLRRFARRRPAGAWIFLGAVCMALYQVAFFAALPRTGVAIGTVLTLGAVPVFTGMITGLTAAARHDRRWWAAAALAVAGCGLLLADGVSAGPRLVTGSLFALTAAAAYSVFTVSASRAVQAGEPGTVMCLIFAGSAVLLAPTLAFGPVGWLATTAGFAVAAYLGLVTTVVAYRLFGQGLRGTCPATASLVCLAEPVCAALLGIAVLGESISLATAAAIVLIVAAPALGTLVLPGTRSAGPDVDLRDVASPRAGRPRRPQARRLEPRHGRPRRRLAAGPSHHADRSRAGSRGRRARARRRT